MPTRYFIIIIILIIGTIAIFGNPKDELLFEFIDLAETAQRYSMKIINKFF